MRCAQAISTAVRDLGIEVRAGVHTGEVETIAGKVGGIAVNVGARIASLAAPSEVLVSHTVQGLVSGSGLRFEDAGEHELKGVPDVGTSTGSWVRSSVEQRYSPSRIDVPLFGVGFPARLTVPLHTIRSVPVHVIALPSRWLSGELPAWIVRHVSEATP